MHIYDGWMDKLVCFMTCAIDFKLQCVKKSNVTEAMFQICVYLL